jgi:hypothetical protein
MGLVSAKQHANCCLWAGVAILGILANTEVSKAQTVDPFGARSNALIKQQRSDLQGEKDRSEARWTGSESSTYVPLDSWIYGVFDRLAGLGYLPDASSVLRPWSRLECSRLLAEAYSNVRVDDEIAAPLLSSLAAEFHRETLIIDGFDTNNKAATLDHVYARTTFIGGVPLRDGFHFGETIVDDFGRPYGKGGNAVAGISTHAEAGRFSIFARGEYQYASALPLYNANAVKVLASTGDSGGPAIPFGWNLRFGTTDRFRPIELYASFQASNWQLSFGQQALGGVQTV